MGDNVDFVLVYDNLPEISRRIKAQVAEIVKRAAEDIEAHAKTNAPIISGNLRNSIKAEMVGEMTAAVVVAAEYAAAVEYGSAAHTITAHNDGYLYFKGKDGHLIRKKSVNHPGSPPKPFLEPAVEAVKPAFLAAIKAAVE